MQLTLELFGQQHDQSIAAPNASGEFVLRWTDAVIAYFEPTLLAFRGQ
jgi:hypothetical protein